MNEKLNTSLHSLEIIAVAGLTAWAVFTGDISTGYLLTLLIFTIAIIEILSLIAVARTYPESHTQFKTGVIVALFILLGIKSMLPVFLCL